MISEPTASALGLRCLIANPQTPCTKAPIFFPDCGHEIIPLLHQQHGLELPPKFSYLWLLHVAGRAEAADRCVSVGVVLLGPHREFVDVVEAAVAVALQTLITFDRRLQDVAVLTGNLQVAELLVEQNVGLREHEAGDGRLRAQRQYVHAGALEHF